jgi:hypothetical protein
VALIAEKKETPVIRQLAPGTYRLYSRSKDPKTGKAGTLARFRRGLPRSDTSELSSISSVAVDHLPIQRRSP